MEQEEETFEKVFKNSCAIVKCVIPLSSIDLEFSYVDYGDKTQNLPLVCIPPLQGGLSSYYHQVVALAAKGYRVISFTWGVIKDLMLLVKVSSLCSRFVSHFYVSKGMDVFFDEILKLQKFHLLGSGFGGFVAQLYTQERPKRVCSLFLINALCDCSNKKLIG